MSEHFRLQEIAEGVHVAIAADEGGGFGNAGIIDLGGRVLLFDTFVTPQAIRDLVQAAKELTGRAPDAAILSHTHIDHFFGACGLPPEADFISTRINQGVLQQLHEQLGAQDREAAKQQLLGQVASLEETLATSTDPFQQYDVRFQLGYLRPYIEAVPELAVRQITMGFDHELAFYGTKRMAVALTYGGGHSPSDVLLHLPDDGILFTGDLVSVECHPFLGAGNTDKWLEILDGIEKLEATHLIAGHGTAGSPQHIGQIRQYIHEMTRMVQDYAAQGGSAEDILQRLPIPEPYRQWRYGSWVYPTNLRTLYAKYNPKPEG